MDLDMAPMVVFKCVCIGLAMGLLSGLVGVGGGVVAVPCFMYFLGFPVHIAMGTSLAVIVPVAISGSIKHHSQGNLMIWVAVATAAAGIFSAWAGAAVNEWLSATPERQLWLKRIFGLLLFYAGAKMIYGTFTNDAAAPVEPVPAVETTAPADDDATPAGTNDEKGTET